VIGSHEIFSFVVSLYESKLPNYFRLEPRARDCCGKKSQALNLANLLCGFLLDPILDPSSAKHGVERHRRTGTKFVEPLPADSIWKSAQGEDLDLDGVLLSGNQIVCEIALASGTVTVDNRFEFGIDSGPIVPTPSVAIPCVAVHAISPPGR
jgi:hypothetical protein